MSCNLAPTSLRILQQMLRRPDIPRKTTRVTCVQRLQLLKQPDLVMILLACRLAVRVRTTAYTIVHKREQAPACIPGSGQS